MVEQECLPLGVLAIAFEAALLAAVPGLHVDAQWQAGQGV
jgi:hypothetical protein